MSLQELKEAIRAAYSPTSLVVTSKDADDLCQRNGITLTTMLRPFCQLETQCTQRLEFKCQVA